MKCAVRLPGKGLTPTQKKWATFLFIGAAVCITQDVLAQSGQTGIQAAETEVKKYFGVGTQLMYAIGGIVGLVGAVKVFNKFNSGDNDTGKVAASWFGSCIFLVVVAAVLRGFFNLP